VTTEQQLTEIVLLVGKALVLLGAFDAVLGYVRSIGRGVSR